MARETDPIAEALAPLATPGWLTEARRKAIHLAFIVLPLDLLFQVLPWPHSRPQWRWLLLALALGALIVDVVRVNDSRVRHFFGTVLRGMLREHEQWNLLGSTYLLIAALLAVEIFPRPIAAAALGYTVLGDALAAMVGKAWGRIRFFGKSLEGGLAGLVGCLAWAALMASTGHLPWSVAVAGALVASLVEFLPIPLDDNLGMTLISGYAMRLMWSPM
jgi:dolichol kinase